MRAELSGSCPTSTDQLKQMKIAEFVQSIEKSQVKMALVSLRMPPNEDLDNHIDRFEDVIEVSTTELREAYS